MSGEQDIKRTQPEIDADVRRALAEADKLTAEAAKAFAEADKAKAEALEAECDARAAQIVAARSEEEERRRKAGDLHHHRYVFGGAVNGASVEKCFAELTVWQRLEPGCPIEIVFNSPGGEVVAGMALFDYIRSLIHAGHEVTTTAMGYAASMAGILLQAGSRRRMGREAYILIHEVSFSAAGSMGDVEDTVEWVKKVQERVLDIFEGRSHMKKDEIRERWRRKDWWLDSTEALELGFVDEVV